MAVNVTPEQQALIDRLNAARQAFAQLNGQQPPPLLDDQRFWDDRMEPAAFEKNEVVPLEQQVIEATAAKIDPKDAKAQAAYAAAKLQIQADLKAAAAKAMADDLAAAQAAVNDKAQVVQSFTLTGPPVVPTDIPPDPPSAPPTMMSGLPLPTVNPPAPRQPSPPKKKRRFLSVVDNLVLKVRHGFGSMLGE